MTSSADAAAAGTIEIGGVSPRQVVLAWLLARSPQVLPIPGTGSAEHAEANVAAASIQLSPDEAAAISHGS